MTETRRILEREYQAARDIHAAAAERPYYDNQRDTERRAAYYGSGTRTKQELQRLLEETHRTQLPYKPFLYVYPWVDLQKDGRLKSLYSGKHMHPEETIQADIRALESAAGAEDAGNQGFGALPADPILNCEHVVPQSWFGKREPMRGDLHHLFACDPGCNVRRGNHPYHDFADYSPETSVQDVIAGCGKQEDDLFEPEYGKGMVARATLYFLLRYPGGIPGGHADLTLLLEWHRQFPVSEYEQHRNQAIDELQGNRNPFIDFPEFAEEWV